MKNETKSQSPKKLEDASILWLIYIPVVIGAIFLILPSLLDIPNTNESHLFYRGIASGMFGLGFLVVILRKELPMRIFLDIVSIKGDFAVIVGWIGLILCWSDAVKNLLTVFLEK
ncbi:MAG: hypothetical protein KJZ72_15825 [Anaerolineales bacterium]|nr:hypothetical protein [Anaerolineales bacterium]